MSVKVIVIKDKPIDQFVISKELTSIGRKSDCDISLKDPAVSGKHAQIQCVGENYLIQDMGSTNGVTIGGRKLKQHVLKNEDIVTIGEHQLKFLISTSGKSDKTNAASSGQNKKKAVSEAAAGQGGGYLKVLNGQDPGSKIMLTGGLTTVGEPGIQMAAVSKRPQGHFIIHVDGGKDKDRVPLVNDEPTGFKSRKLEPGDKIEVAGIEMEYQPG